MKGKTKQLVVFGVLIFVIVIGCVAAFLRKGNGTETKKSAEQSTTQTTQQSTTKQSDGITDKSTEKGAAAVSEKKSSKAADTSDSKNEIKTVIIEGQTETDQDGNVIIQISEEQTSKKTDKQPETKKEKNTKATKAAETTKHKTNKNTEASTKKSGSELPMIPFEE